MDNRGAKKKKEVFIIDDDASIGEILSFVLAEDYTVHTFTKGETAVAHLSRYAPQAIVLDYTLPGENTDDIITHIRQTIADVVIVLISANTYIRKKSEDLAVDAFVAKPFAREAILEALQRNLH